MLARPSTMTILATTMNGGLQERGIYTLPDGDKRYTTKSTEKTRSTTCIADVEHDANFDDDCLTKDHHDNRREEKSDCEE